MEKTRVCNLWHRPRTRLIRGIHLIYIHVIYCYLNYILPFFQIYSDGHTTANGDPENEAARRNRWTIQRGGSLNRQHFVLNCQLEFSDKYYNKYCK